MEKTIDIHSKDCKVITVPLFISDKYQSCGSYVSVENQLVGAEHLRTEHYIMQKEVNSYTENTNAIEIQPNLTCFFFYRKKAKTNDH